MNLSAQHDEIWLTEAELRRLCGGKKKKDAQKRALKRLRYCYTEDAAGRPLVLRADAERRAGARARSPEPRREPDFSVFPKVA